MKKTILALSLMLAMSTAAFSQMHSDTTRVHKKTTTTHKKMMGTTKYTCTMHPEVVMNKPGKCPKCGMKLVAVGSKKTTTTKKTEMKM